MATCIRQESLFIDDSVEIGEDLDADHATFETLLLSNFLGSNVSSVDHVHQMSGGVADDHNHDGRYYTAIQSDGRYSRLTHNHQGTYALTNHGHTGFSPTNHNHDVRYSQVGHTHTGGGTGTSYWGISATASQSSAVIYPLATEIKYRQDSDLHFRGTRITLEGSGANQGIATIPLLNVGLIRPALSSGNLVLATGSFIPFFSRGGDIGSSTSEWGIIHAEEGRFSGLFRANEVNTSFLSSQQSAGISVDTSLNPDSHGGNNYNLGRSNLWWNSAYIQDIYIDTLHLDDFEASNVSERGHTHFAGQIQSHNHDGRYYTEIESDLRFALTTHDHSGTGEVTSHIHDDRYYTETEANGRFSLNNHNHNANYFTQSQILANYYTRNESNTRFSLTSHSHAGGSTTFGVPISIGSTNSGGSSSDHSRANHRHSHPTGMHERGGLVEMDGDRLDVDYIPVNYDRSLAPSQVTNAQHLTAHLRGIDNELAGMSTMGPTDEYIQDLVGKMFVDGLQTGVRLTYDDANAEMDSAITNEYIYDLVGGMFTGNTFTGGASLHRDSANKIDFRIDFPTAPTAPDVPWTAVPSDVRPSLPNQYDLGSSSFAWGTIHGHIIDAQTRVQTEQVLTNSISAFSPGRRSVDFGNHINVRGHVVQNVGVTRFNSNGDPLFPQDGLVRTVAEFNENYPSGSVWMGENTAADIFGAFFGAIASLIGVDAVAAAVSEHNDGRLIIRIGDNLYVFNSSEKIILTGV